MSVKLDGCPCGTHGRCCTEPDTYGGHDAFCDCDNEWCDYRWHMGCRACGARCGCEV